MNRARTTAAKEARRLVLLEAALDEFFEKGFFAARMEDIAAGAGLSKGTLYLYFDSKDALFREIIETFAVANVARLEAAVEAAPDFAAAVDVLTTFAPRLIRHSRMPRLMKVLVADAVSFPEVVQAYRRDVVDRVLRLVTGMLERGQATGELARDVDASACARLVVAPIAFSALWQVTFDAQDAPTVDLEALFALHGRMLERALAPAMTAANDDRRPPEQEAGSENEGETER